MNEQKYNVLETVKLIFYLMMLSCFSTVFGVGTYYIIKSIHNGILTMSNLCEIFMFTSLFAMFLTCLILVYIKENRRQHDTRKSKKTTK